MFWRTPVIKCANPNSLSQACWDSCEHFRARKLTTTQLLFWALVDILCFFSHAGLFRERLHHESSRGWWKDRATERTHVWAGEKNTKKKKNYSNQGPWGQTSKHFNNNYPFLCLYCRHIYWNMAWPCMRNMFPKTWDLFTRSWWTSSILWNPVWAYRYALGPMTYYTRQQLIKILGRYWIHTWVFTENIPSTYMGTWLYAIRKYLMRIEDLVHKCKVVTGKYLITIPHGFLVYTQFLLSVYLIRTTLCSQYLCGKYLVITLCLLGMYLVFRVCVKYLLVSTWFFNNSL